MISLSLSQPMSFFILFSSPSCWGRGLRERLGGRLAMALLPTCGDVAIMGLMVPHPRDCPSGKSLLCVHKSPNVNWSLQRVTKGKRHYYKSTFLDRLLLRVTIWSWPEWKALVKIFQRFPNWATSRYAKYRWLLMAPACQRLENSHGLTSFLAWVS